MVFKWRDEQTETFVDYYTCREHECLWNVSSDSYKNKAARDSAYNKICKDLNLSGLTVTDVKNKIKIMRTNYNIELKKILKSEKSGSGFDDIYVPRVFWFKKVDCFLRGVSRAKESLSNLVSTSLLVEIIHVNITLSYHFPLPRYCFCGHKLLGVYIPFVRGRFLVIITCIID